MDIIEEDCIDPMEELLRSCHRVLEAGVWLIRNGYGRLALLPYAAPTGAWRCEFHVLGRPDKVLFRYTSASGPKYLADHCGGSVRRDVKPAKLGPAIMQSVPEELREACEGEASAETLRWLDQLENAMANGFVPQAFHEYTEDHSNWTLVRVDGRDGLMFSPQPGYVFPGEQRTALAEPLWSDALRRWDDLVARKDVRIDCSALEDDEICFVLARRLKEALNDVEPFDAMRVLRAAVALIGERSK